MHLPEFAKEDSSAVTVWEAVLGRLALEMP